MKKKQYLQQESFRQNRHNKSCIRSHARQGHIVSFQQHMNRLRSFLENLMFCTLFQVGNGYVAERIQKQAS